MNIVTENEEVLKSIFVQPQAEILSSSPDNIAAERALWHWWNETVCQLVAMTLEVLDEALYQEYKEKGWRVERMDSRTVQCLFGPLTYKRRLLVKPDSKAKRFYPLDRKLGFEKGKRYSLALMERIVRIMSMTTSRNTSQAVALLTQCTVSHQTVVAIKNEAGKKANEYARVVAENEPAEKISPKDHILAIEGDGIVMKLQKDRKAGNDEKGGKTKELHRVQVYTGVERNGQRSQLTGCRCFVGESREQVVQQANAFIHRHYDLSSLTVLSNGDGGAGYSFNDFDGIVEGCKRHEHFRDKYHVNEKIRTRLSFCQPALINTFIRTIGTSSSQNIRENVKTLLDTAESQARTKEETEQVKKLRGYLDRNMDYIPSLSLRGIDVGDSGIRLGTAESGHRYYSFRMKKQGRCWSIEGLENMAGVMTAIRNGELEQALLYKASGTNYKKTDRAMHKAASRVAREAKDRRQEAQYKRKASKYRPGCIEGRIAVYGPTSSPMGQLAKAIQNW